MVCGDFDNVPVNCISMDIMRLWNTAGKKCWKM